MSSTNWATGPQAQTGDEFDDCFLCRAIVIVSNKDKHYDYFKGGNSTCKRQALGQGAGCRLAVRAVYEKVLKGAIWDRSWEIYDRVTRVSASVGYCKAHSRLSFCSSRTLDIIGSVAVEMVELYATKAKKLLLQSLALPLYTQLDLPRIIPSVSWRVNHDLCRQTFVIVRECITPHHANGPSCQPLQL